MRITLIIAAVICCSCTQQYIAKNAGGTATIDLPKGIKLVSATWKDDELWYLARPMRTDEQPEVLTLRESASFGIVEGKVIFKESR